MRSILLLCHYFLLLTGGRFDVVKAQKKEDCVVGGHDIAPDSTDPAPDTFTVQWITSASATPIILEVHRSWSPLGVDRFHQLLQDNFFNCAAFFRVVPDFVVQFGIAAEPDESKKWDATISDDTVTESNTAGTISFATAGKNTRTTQLFINLVDNSNLDRMGFSPFGKVVSGMEVLTSIYNPTPLNQGGVDQKLYKDMGNEWILEEYPNIDIIESTTLTE